MVIPDLPRLRLARLPTPVESLEILSELLTVDLYVKRDDLTGSALTGNKIRKLEFVLADAIRQEADAVVTCGGAQSNHCRATALACRQIGLTPELFLREADSGSTTGNFLLDRLVGAKIHNITAEEYQGRAELMERRRVELEAEGINSYVIPEGASNALGSMGYVTCMEEILETEDAEGLNFDFLITAVGSGGTFAGLLAGARLLGFGGRVLGIPVCDDAKTFAHKCENILVEMQKTLVQDLGDTSVPESDLIDGFVGEGYARATEEELQRLADIAVLTGLILDPVYTNKAFGALLTLVRDGAIPSGSRVLFLHTGGIHGLYAFGDQLPI